MKDDLCAISAATFSQINEEYNSLLIHTRRVGSSPTMVALRRDVLPTTLSSPKQRPAPVLVLEK